MKINFEHRTIELTAKEMKKAENYGSPEYYKLIHAMADLPTFTVRTKYATPTYNANRNLTYAYMGQYIAHNAPEQMDTFTLLKSTSNYPTVSKWFREAFPNTEIEEAPTTNLCVVA